MELWISLWSIGPNLTETDLWKMKEAGVQGVEIWAEHQKADEYLRLANQCGLKTGMHLPFHDLNLATFDPVVAERTLAVLSEWIQRLAAQRAEHAVLHAGYAWAYEDRHEARFKVQERLHVLGDIASEAGVHLLLENLIPDKLNYTHNFASTVKEWIELLTDCNLGACLDIGHLIIMEEDPIDTIKKLGDRLMSVHYSDNDRSADLHLLPGDGSNITAGLCDFLKAEGFTGPLVYEINPYRYTMDEILLNIRGARV
jgi:sugar phosphate isomerase/epimerase